MPATRRPSDPEGSHFRHEQRGVAVSMAAALCISLFALGAAAVAGQGTPAGLFAERLQMTLRADCLVIICFAATIANVARLRFVSVEDIAGSASSGGSATLRQASAIAQNTLEQAVLALATHCVVTATFARSQALVATLVGLFVVGRLLFWAGYGRGAKGRALGFGLTFYPSVLALLASLASLLIGLLPSG